jgi:hypothetical protein
LIPVKEIAIGFAHMAKTVAAVATRRRLKCEAEDTYVKDSD